MQHILNKRSLSWRLSLTVLIGLILGACSQERIDENFTDQNVQAGGPAITLHFEASEADLSRASRGDARALDFVLLNETSGGRNVVNPKLDHEQFKQAAGVPVRIVMVSSDPSQPVTVATTRLVPKAFNSSDEVVSAEEVYPGRHYLRTEPYTGNTITMAAGTDLTKGTWRMALIVGGQEQSINSATERKLVIDPNNFAQLGTLPYLRENYGIEDQYDQGKWNIEVKQPTTKKDSYTSAEKVAMDVPFFSDWKEIPRTAMHPYNGTTWIEAGSFTLNPQGTLFRIKLENKDFDEIDFAGMRILTNSFAFRGNYNLSDNNLRALSQGTKSLVELWDGFKATDASRALEDSISRTDAYPNPADFFVDKNKKLTLKPGETSENYVLVWAMPKTIDGSVSQSREGNMHILYYDNNRKGSEYNRLRLRSQTGYPLTPIALIRKPAYSSSYGNGAFKISNGTTRGQFFRLVGQQTKIYNFLDFVDNDDAEATFYTADEMRALSDAGDKYIPSKEDWAMIFPAKLSDVSYRVNYYGANIDQRHYFLSNGIIGGWAANVAFNSNRFAVVDDWTSIFIGQTIGNRVGTLDLVLDPTDKYTPVQAGDPSKAGKSNNKHNVRIPKEMLVPRLLNGQNVNATEKSVALNFSTYKRNGDNAEEYLLNGFGEGQLYLTAIRYYTDRRNNQVIVRARYLGPSFARPHRDDNGSPWAGISWVQGYPWDIAFYVWMVEGAFQDSDLSNNQKETEDTRRTFKTQGFLVKGNSSPVTDTNSPDYGESSVVFWSKDGNWFYLHTLPSKNTNMPGPKGFGVPIDRKTTAYTAADNPKALVHYFLKTPSATRR